MRKIFVIITLLVMVLVTINLCDCMFNKTLSDEELVEVYLLDEGRNDYDRIVVCDNGDGYISYTTYEDDVITHGGYINREYYAHKYE